MPNGSTLTCYVGASNNTAEYPTRYGIVQIVKHSQYRIALTFTATLAITPKHWVGTATIDVFGGWIPVATATPPQEYDLPLAAGYTSAVKYGKSQDGKLFIYGMFSHDPFVPGRDYTICSLPVGYRPSSNLPVSAWGATSDSLFAPQVVLKATILKTGGFHVYIPSSATDITIVTLLLGGPVVG